MRENRFIVFEGIDGAGKTTQMELLARFLERRGVSVVRTREPGGTRLGGIVRDLILDPGHVDLKSRTEAFLYAADRAQHVAEVIRPALEMGHTVLCDRFLYSTLAYQGWGRGIDLELLTALNNLATGGLVPDQVVLLDLEVGDGLGRVYKGRIPDRLENEKEAFFSRVRQGYLDQAAQWPELFKLVPAGAPVEQVHGRVLAALGLDLE